MNTRSPYGIATPAERAELPAYYLTPRDVAALFRVPLETVYGWRKKRTGPPGFRVGKHLRYDPVAVLDYQRTQQRQQNQAAA